MATTYFQTYKEIQDKLADVIRTELGVLVFILMTIM